MGKKVLVIEDEEGERLALHGFLVELGFEVYSAGEADEAFRLAKQVWNELDVAILDMQLDEDDPSVPTGADIATEVKRNVNSFDPELLIYSHREQINFYQTSFDLGVATYLLKDSANLEVVARHVRALALRRSINVDNPAIISELNRIVVNSGSKPETIVAFCEGILKRELQACLGAPFVVLFTEGKKTRNCASSDDSGLPSTNDLYHTLQALAHGKGNFAEPFVLETVELKPARDEETLALYEKLNQAAFLPLALAGDLKLSIGILREDRPESDARSLCNVLGQYLRATVFENVINLWSQWTELHATRTSIVRLCLLVGQEIRNAQSAGIDRLEVLANDLTDTGQLLDELEDGVPQINRGVSSLTILRDTWRRLAQVQLSEQIQFDPGGDCLLFAQRPDLDFIFSRLLQWFVWRTKIMPLDVKPAIRIACEHGKKDATIVFEDNSRRLPATLRKDLFAPFTQAVSIPFPRVRGVGKKSKKSVAGKTEVNDMSVGSYFPLYLVKMLVEGRYHGSLKDCSDEITEHSYGHRIVMQFPRA